MGVGKHGGEGRVRVGARKGGCPVWSEGVRRERRNVASKKRKQ